MRFLWPLVFFISACTHVVQFTKTLPAEILLPAGAQEMLFISRFDTSLVAFDDRGDADALKASFTALTQGLTEGYEKLDSITFIPADSVIRGQWFRFTEKLSFTDSLSLESIHQQHPQAFLLTLDLFSPVLDYLDLEITREGFEIGTYEIILEAAFTLYDPQGQIYDQVLVDAADLVRHKQIDVGLVLRHPSIKVFEEKVKFLATQLGSDYAELFVPVAMEVSRNYYNGKELNAAASLMAQKQWQAAEELLVELTDHEDKKTAQKAAYNLIVVYEALGKQ